MIIKRLIVCVSLVLAASMVLMTDHVSAEESAPVTESQLMQIRSRCKEVQATLSRVHANDALLRVNRGQVYERLSTKLMVPLNSRIVLNRLDGSTLLKITSNYEQHLSEFRLNYQAYEEQLSNAMRIDCTKQPANFYQSLQSARQKRQIVYDSVQNLTKDIADYKITFVEFARPYKEAKQ